MELRLSAITATAYSGPTDVAAFIKTERGIEVYNLVSRFSVGYLTGGGVMMAYFALRPTWPFWALLVLAVVSALVSGHLAEKYLTK